MSEPRYIVEAITGFVINPQSYGSDGSPRTSFSVLDTPHNYREVYTEYTSTGGYAARSRRAHAECSRLNALEEADEREHARRTA